jgi:hypothetical protein
VTTLRARLGLLLLLCLAAVSTTLQGAGVTIITHGLNGDIDDWVIAMAGRIARYPGFPGTDFTCYQIDVLPGFNVTATRIGGNPPAQTDSGEILIKLDWRQLANNSYSTYQVASAVAPQLLRTNFVPELNGHALAEFPLHLVGHSRGGSLICQLSALLGTNGVWVDHLTTLDPHPLNNDGFSDFPYTVVDAPARTYENVLFHDNYYQTLDLIAYGEPVSGAYVRKLTNLSGGYSGLGGAHSDVHLWYHGTIDFRVPADDTVATITAAERQAWWTASETSGAHAGYYYSRVGGGDRVSTNRPAGSGTSPVRDGYNQRWGDLGAGSSSNRMALATNDGTWPSLIRFDLAGTNYLVYSQTTSVTVYYQLAKPATSNGVVSLYLDNDFNPLNGNERLLDSFIVTGTTAAAVMSGTTPITVTATNAPVGRYAVFAKMLAGGRSRYLYTGQLLEIAAALTPPRLDIVHHGDGSMAVGVNGVAGQTIVLQNSSDLRNWQSLVTNTLFGNRWVLTNAQAASRLFFRGVLQ